MFTLLIEEYKLDICVYPIDWGGPGEYKLDIYVYPIDWGVPGEYKLDIFKTSYIFLHFDNTISRMCPVK